MSSPHAPHSRWIILAITACLLVLAMGGVLMFGRVLWSDSKWENIHLAESRARGDQIIRALKAYKQAHGEYPAALTQLVPTTTPSIPAVTVSDRPWRYRKPSSTSFVLAFDANRDQYPCSWYDSETGRWATDQ